jgi:hypothetical protein
MHDHTSQILNHFGNPDSVLHGKLQAVLCLRGLVADLVIGRRYFGADIVFRMTETRGEERNQEKKSSHGLTLLQEDKSTSSGCPPLGRVRRKDPIPPGFRPIEKPTHAKRIPRNSMLRVQTTVILKE